MAFKKKQKGPLRSIISEVVPDAAMDEFKENTSFITPDGDYIGLVIDGDEMNLSKKVKLNSDLGQFIHSVNEGMISSYTPSDLLDENKFIVIPNPTSLADMGEFTMLTRREYPLVFIDRAGAVRQSDIRLNFDDLTEISDGKADLADFLDEDDDDEAEVEDIPVTAAVQKPKQELPVEPEPEMEPAVTPLPVSEPLQKPEPEPEQDAIHPQQAAESESEQDEQPNPEPQEPIQPAQEAAEQTQENIPLAFDSQNAAENTKDYFLSVNGVKITYPDNYLMQRINANTDLEFKMIPYMTEESPLKDVINQKIAVYNTELANIHQTNLATAERTFRSMMAKYAEQFTHEFDVYNPEGEFGKQKIALDQMRQKVNQQVAQEVQNEKERLEKSFEVKKQIAVDQAVNQASQQFDEVNLPVMQAEIRSFEEKKENDVEREYQENFLSLRRRANAALQDNLMISLNIVADTVMSKYEPVLKAEQQHFQERLDEFQKYVADVEKKEIQAIETKAQEEKRNNDLAILQRQHQAEMEKAKQTYSREISELEISKSQSEAQLTREKEQMEKDLQAQLRSAESRISGLESEKQQITEDLNNADERAMAKAEKKVRKKVRKENDEKIHSLESSIAALEDKQKTTRRYFIYGMIGLTILGIVIGVVAGMTMNFNMSRQSSVDQIKEDFYKMLNDKNQEE